MNNKLFDEVSNMFKKVCGVLKIVLPVLMFLAIIITIILTPLRAVNVSMLVYLSGCEDGTPVTLSITQDQGAQEEPAISKFITYSYNSNAGFNLPASVMNNASEISLDISSKSGVRAHTWALYYGKHDINNDTLMHLFTFNNAKITQTTTSVVYEFSDTDVKSFNTTTANDWITKAVVCGFVTFAFLIVVFSIYSFRNKSWCVALRRAFIIMPVVLVVLYLLLSSVISDKVSHSTEDFGSLNNAEYIQVDSKISRKFTTTQDGLNNLTLYAQLEGEPAHLGIRIVNNDKSVLVLSDTVVINESGEFSLYIPAYMLNTNATYTLDVVKLNPNDNSVIKLAATDSELNLKTGYCNILFSGYAGAVAIVICMIAVLISVFYKKLHLSASVACALVYIVMFIFSASQIMFFAISAGLSAGEAEGISYIAYLAKTGNFIPEFRSMPVLNEIAANTAFSDVQMNTLGTPPLYYLIMKLFGAVKVSDLTVSLDVFRLRMFSCLISFVAIASVYLIGYLRINKSVPSFHLLFATITGGIPSVTYLLSRISPAPIAFIGVSLFFVGMMRLAGTRRDKLTYFIVSLGILICCLSDTLIGAISLAILLVYILFACIKNKDYKIIFRKNAFFALPLFLVAAAYYVTTYILYGSFNPQTFVNVGGTLLSAAEFTKMYFGDFLNTWSSLFNDSFNLADLPWHSLVNIVTLLLLLAPITLFKIRKIPKIPVLIISYLTCAAMLIYCFTTAYANYYYQTGNYNALANSMFLCFVPFLGYSVVAALIELYNSSRLTAGDKPEGYICIEPKKTANLTATLSSILLLISGYVFFIFNFGVIK